MRLRQFAMFALTSMLGTFATLARATQNARATQKIDPIEIDRLRYGVFEDYDGNRALYTIGSTWWMRTATGVEILAADGPSEQYWGPSQLLPNGAIVRGRIIRDEGIYDVLNFNYATNEIGNLFWHLNGGILTVIQSAGERVTANCPNTSGDIDLPNNWWVHPASDATPTKQNLLFAANHYPESRVKTLYRCFNGDFRKLTTLGANDRLHWTLDGNLMILIQAPEYDSYCTARPATGTLYILAEDGSNQAVEPINTTCEDFPRVGTYGILENNLWTVFSEHGQLMRRDPQGVRTALKTLAPEEHVFQIGPNGTVLYRANGKIFAIDAAGTERELVVLSPSGKETFKWVNGQLIAFHSLDGARVYSYGNQ